MITPDRSPYIELLKKCLIDYSKIGKFEHHPLPIVDPNWKTAILYPIDKLLRKRYFALSKLKFVSERSRFFGEDWPAEADTMIGLQRLNNIEHCVRGLINEGIEGDLVEAGVWRGGAVILMRAMLKELNIKDRKVWALDSFEGLPTTTGRSEDKGNELHKHRILKASLEQVKNNFHKYDLLDDQVEFVQGWFSDTLPIAPIYKIALLRIDADLYSSTMESLTFLYPKLSSNGFVIIDDYNSLPTCRKAVDDYRRREDIISPMIKIDKEAIFWKK